MSSEVVQSQVQSTVTTHATRTVIRESREYTVHCGCCDPLWLVTTIEGVLKLLQFLSTFLAFVILTSHDQSSKPQYEFLIFVGTTAWIFVMMHIVLRMTHIYEKLPFVLIQPKVTMVCCGLAVLVFLIASSVVLGYAYGRSLLLASAAFGYIAMFLFLFELIWVFVRFRRGGTTTEEVRREDVRADDFVQRKGDVDY